MYLIDSKSKNSANKERMSATLDPEVLLRARKAAMIRDSSLSSFVNDALEHYIQHLETAQQDEAHEG